MAQFVRTTPEPRQVKGIDMSRVISRCPVPEHVGALRDDPYWGGAWDGVAGAVWTSYGNALNRGRPIPAEFRIDPQQAMETMLGERSRADKLRFLGAVHGWRTLTAQQAATITGSRRIASARRAIAASAYAASLVDLGIFPNVLDHSSLYTNTGIYRPTDSEVFERRVKPRLTFSEWVSVTGGRDWNPNGQYDRHNILATELGLRLSEYTSTSTVLGETFSRVDDLTGDEVARFRAADLTAVRGDGLRIAFEITASASSAIERKIEKWAETLARSPMRNTGLVVVFMVAMPPEKGRQGGEVRARVMRAIERACIEYPGTFDDRTKDRLMAVSWEEWFPADHQLSMDFVQGRAHIPANLTDENAPTNWATTCLLDGPRTPDDELYRLPSNTVDLRCVIGNASLLAGTPHWLREGAEKFWEDRLVRPEETPHLPGSSELGKGQGVSGTTRPAARLLGV